MAVNIGFMVSTNYELNFYELQMNKLYELPDYRQAGE